MLSKKTHFRFKDISMLKVEEWKKLHHANNNRKKPGVPILIRDFNIRIIVGEGLSKIMKRQYVRKI